MKTAKYAVLAAFLTLVCTASTPKDSGTTTIDSWISSGGELFATDKNPWFVKNTTDVKYCLNMDEASFSVSKSQAETLIREALDFWYTEFKNNRAFFSPPFGAAAIATQNFVYSACADDTDLQFKFGANTLTDQEKQKLIEPRRFVGVTVRKTYDPLTLKGQGIIYITADRGPTAYLNTGELVDKAWQSPALLKYALMHELGHVFGIPHVGAGLMSEVFMDTLLNKSMADGYASEPQQGFLNPPADFDVCRITGKFNPDFFQVAKGTPCLLLRQIPGQPFGWKVYSADDQKLNPVEAGTLQGVSLDSSPYGLKPAVTVQIPHEQMDLPVNQRIFQPSETVMGPFLVGAVFSQQAFSGVFTKVKGKPISLNMSLSADLITLVGTLNNQQVTVLNYTPMSFMRSLLP